MSVCREMMLLMLSKLMGLMTADYELLLELLFSRETPTTTIR